MMYSIHSQFYTHTSLAQLPGIGRRTPRALARLGMKTIGQFVALTEGEVGVLLGGSGIKLLRIAKSLLTEGYARA